MFEHAVYYSRRERDEIAAAQATTDHRVRQIHLLLAEKYSQLAKRELARMEADAPSSGAQSLGGPASAGDSRPRYR